MYHKGNCQSYSFPHSEAFFRTWLSIYFNFQKQSIFTHGVNAFVRSYNNYHNYRFQTLQEDCFAMHSYIEALKGYDKGR